MGWLLMFFALLGMAVGMFIMWAVMYCNDFFLGGCDMLRKIWSAATILSFIALCGFTLWHQFSGEFVKVLVDLSFFILIFLIQCMIKLYEIVDLMRTRK